MEAARPATAEDVAELVALHAAAADELQPARGGALFLRREGRPVGDEAGFEKALDDIDQHVVVGTIDGTPVGYGVVRVEHLRDGGRLGIIEDLFVLPGARAVGVGEVIMDELVAFCEARDCLGIDAVALPGNRDTKNFFETFGLVARAIVVHRPLPRPDRSGDG